MACLVSCTNVYQWLCGTCCRLRSMVIFRCGLQIVSTANVGIVFCFLFFVKLIQFYFYVLRGVKWVLLSQWPNRITGGNISALRKHCPCNTAQTCRNKSESAFRCMLVCMHARALHMQVTERTEMQGCIFAGSRTRMWFTKHRFYAEAVWLQSSLSCATFWREPLPPPLRLSLLASLPVSSQWSVARAVSLTAVAMFPRVILKGSMIKKSQQKKRTSPCNYKERFFVLDTQDLKYSENRPGVRERLETKRFIRSSSLRDKLRNTIVIG